MPRFSQCSPRRGVTSRAAGEIFPLQLEGRTKAVSDEARSSRISMPGLNIQIVNSDRIAYAARVCWSQGTSPIDGASVRLS